ncbi:hypothetical protein ACFPIF_14700 [Brevundimonas faecalis]|uniref:hypothetical protein n=1 Tax=Brevundimonas faecalis TaxID=947378 RepID=UPI003618A8A2
MSGAWADKPVYWATLGYARWWLMIDGLLLKKVRRDGLTPKTLRAILINYDVNRAVSDANALRFIDHVHAANATWPDDLLGRSQVCAGFARDAKALGLTTKEHASAATKVMWFLQPNGWTLFDSYAATGAGISKALTGVDRMLAFYERLDERGFCDVAEVMQREVERSVLPDISAARILDSMLMASGGRGNESEALRETQDFVDLLATSTAGGLIGLAESLQQQVGTDVLSLLHTKVKQS